MLDCNATPVLSHVACFDDSDVAASARGITNFGQWVGLIPRVIIAGPPRSGTTALLRALWQHPAVAGGGNALTEQLETFFVSEDPRLEKGLGGAALFEDQ